MKPLTIGHSPDPDDAFMFYAMTHDRIDTGGMKFRDHLEGIEGLNQRALRGEFEISAVSLHQFPYIASQYRMMPVGASIGDGYGPIVVARPENAARAVATGRLAIPGERTTATLLLKLRFGDSLRTSVEDFDRIMDLVVDGTYDFGLLIHEGQLTYRERGLALVEDLGAWWLAETGLPTPLGINVIRRDVAEHDRISEILRDSIRWGFEHLEEAAGYASRYARGLDDDRVRKFVRMYVNDFTVDLGDRGRRAVELLMQRGAERGLLPGIRVEF